MAFPATSRDLFSELDRDGDGVISRDEFERLSSRLRPNVSGLASSASRSSSVPSRSEMGYSARLVSLPQTGAGILTSYRVLPPQRLPQPSVVGASSFGAQASLRGRSMPPESSVLREPARDSEDTSVPVVPIFGSMQSVPGTFSAPPPTIAPSYPLPGTLSMPQFTPQQPSIAPPTDMFQTSSFQLPATTVTSAVQPSTVLLGMSAPTANVQPAFSVPQADEELFGALDFDANGKITRESFINAATEGWEDPNKSLFDEFDLGKDGLISREEFIAAAMGEVIHEPRDDVKPEQLFVLRDMDGELTNGGGDVFSRFDKDADGKISKEEFLEALAGQQRDPELGLRVLDAEGRDFRIQGLNFCGFPVKAELAFDDDDDINSNNFGGMKLDPLKVDLSGLNLHALVPGLPEIPEYDWNANCADRCLMRCDATCDIYENFCGSCCFRLEQLFGYGCINSMLSFFTGKMTWLFTLLCILLFGLPIWIIDRIGKDMQVKYWITDMLFIVWLLPCLYILTHIVHSKRSNPSRTMVIICLIGSCIWLLILGDFVLVKAYSRANVLISKDCTSDLAKSYLQVQWENAQVFYQNCMEETALSTGSSLEVAYSLYRIQDCQGYLGQLVANPAWPYLGALEDEYQCGGWCLRKQPLWTFKSVKDSCSATVADVLYTKVQWFTLQVVVYSTIVLVLVSFALIQTGPILRSHSIEW